MEMNEEKWYKGFWKSNFAFGYLILISYLGMWVGNYSYNTLNIPVSGAVGMVFVTMLSLTLILILIITTFFGGNNETNK